MVLENTLKSLLDWRESKQSILREVILEYSLEGLVLKLKLQYLNSWCKVLTLWKRPWCWERQEEKGTTDDNMVRWHHLFNGYEFGQTLGDGEGQRSLVFCSPWVAKSWTWLSDWTTTHYLFMLVERCLYVFIFSLLNSTVMTIFSNECCVLTWLLS